MRNLFHGKRNVILISILTLLSLFAHFYNLNWGSPFYFNPDERNIVSSVTQLQFPQQMNPHFFAYGSLPIYAIYFLGIVANHVSQTPFLTVTFDQAIIISRALSAFFATLSIPLLYFLGKKLQNEKTGLLAAFFATASVGFIQFAHFGTFEMWLTFFGMLLFWLCLNYQKKPHPSTLILAGLIFGILVSVKVSSLALLPIPLGMLIANRFGHYKTKHLVIIFVRVLKDSILFSIVALLVYLMTNPYAILDQKDLVSSMQYESSVALGTEKVFYTSNFANTMPGIYQLLHVYPFLLNPLMTLVFIPALIYLLFLIFKHREKQYLLLASFFLLLFTSQTVLFVKWTRYMMPTLPFIYLICATAFTRFTVPPKLRSFAMIGFLIICAIFSFSYFKTAFINTDTRIAALYYAQHKIPLTANILSEPADLGVLPFQDGFPHIDTFNFYESDNNSPDATDAQLQQKLAAAQYIILPSQRILQSRMTNPNLFPKGHLFYEQLFNGTLGFKKIYKTPCDLFCKITYLNDPIFWWEQTTSVFDRPTVFIFKKNIQ